MTDDACIIVCCCSGTASNVDEALAIAAEIGRFPLIIRPAFTLGGTGGGISYNMEEFVAQVKAGIDASMTDQVRSRWSVAAWDSHMPKGPSSYSSAVHCSRPIVSGWQCGHQADTTQFGAQEA